MYATPWMQCCDRAVFLPVLEPGAARRGPGHSGHEIGNVFRKILDCLGIRANGDDVFELALHDDFRDVFSDVLGDGNDTAMANGRVWTKEGWG